MRARYSANVTTKKQQNGELPGRESGKIEAKRGVVDELGAQKAKI